MKEETHMPKICEKSKCLDNAKRRIEAPRFEVLNRIGQEYSNRKKRHIREKEKQEEQEVRSYSFRPDCKKREQDENLISAFGVDLVDRNEKWAQRRDEKLQRLKIDQDKNIEASCSFRPVTVTDSHQNKYERQDDHDNSQYYSSVFVQDGIKSYFTRLEQARKMKKEAELRLGSITLTQKTGVEINRRA